MSIGMVALEDTQNQFTPAASVAAEQLELL
jgi:hypothetical protein